jgi:hypothetical protein
MDGRGRFWSDYHIGCWPPAFELDLRRRPAACLRRHLSKPDPQYPNQTPNRAIIPHQSDSRSDHASIPGRRSSKSARRAKWITIGCGLRSPLEIDTSRGYSKWMATRYGLLLREEFGVAEPQAVLVRRKSNERSGTLPIAGHRPWRRKESGARLPSNNVFGRNCGC